MFTDLRFKLIQKKKLILRERLAKHLIEVNKIKQELDIRKNYRIILFKFGRLKISEINNNGIFKENDRGQMYYFINLESNYYLTMN